MIIGAFVSPHPPVAVAEIGRGEEKKIEATIDGYHAMAEQVAEWAPDTIVVSSPHAVLYRDWFNVSSGRHAYGDFGQFRAEEVSFEKEYDVEMTNVLEKLMKQDHFPGGMEYDRDKMLDHGTMVPLYFIDQKYTSYKLVRVSLSGFSLVRHYAFGEYIKKAAEILKRRVVFIASGDLAHDQKEDGPYGFKPEGPEYDRRIMSALGNGCFEELFEYEPEFLEKAMECGHRSFVIMAGALDQTGVKPHVYSHEATFGVGYGIVGYEITGKDENRNFLEQYKQKERKRIENKHKDAYVHLAYDAVNSWIGKRKVLSVMEGLPDELLNQKAGVFVSIHEFGMLRGCIGTISPVKDNIAREIISNAISASSRDPRFEMIQEEELPYLDISVDILDKPERIHSEKELDVKRYGVIVSMEDGRRGLLLPDLDGVDTVEDQIRIAAQKGNISLDEEYILERFEVTRHG